MARKMLIDITYSLFARTSQLLIISHIIDHVNFQSILKYKTIASYLYDSTEYCRLIFINRKKMLK